MNAAWGVAEDSSDATPVASHCRTARSIRIVGGGALAVMFAYAVFSTPGLLARWDGVTLAGAAVLALWAGLAALALPVARRPPAAPLIALFAAATILLRVTVAMPYLGRTLGGDALFYPMIADGLLHGEGLRIYEPYIGGTMRALYPPVYPLLLAGWGAVAGLSTAALAAMNLVIDGGAAWMTLRLCKRIGQPGVGRAAAWLYLIWPSVLLSSPVAQKEGLIALLVVALATAWLDLRRDVGVRTIVTTGVLTGLLALTQPALAPLSGLIGICMFAWQPRRLMRCAVPAALVAGLVMLPWWIRNWMLFHAFVPLTSSAQISLWIGNNPAATGNWVPTPVALKGLPELEYARAAGAMARAWIVQHPVDFARLTLEKFLRATGAAQAEIARLSQARPAPATGIASMLFPASQACHLLLLASSAAMLLALRRRLPGALGPLLLACGAQLVFFNVWFEFGERHREFVIPFLITLAVAAVAHQSSAPCVGGHATDPTDSKTYSGC